VSSGNILEWFDFGIFIFLAPVIGQQFFPTHDPLTASIAAYAVFAVGFLCRPLGGIFFGHRGDTRGRANTLRLSILLITSTTFLVGLLPTYHTIGILSSILFVLLRIAQGISVGGEYSGVMVYLAESAPAKHRGFITSFAATGANIGFLLATFAVMLLQNYLASDVFDRWGWRLPFLLAGSMGSVVLYYRLHLQETPAYTALKLQNRLSRSPFLIALTKSPRQLLRILGLTCMSATFYYVFFGYMTNYLENFLGIKAHIALLLQSVLLIAMLVLVPLAGYLGDRLGRKRMLLFTVLSIILLALPCFYLLQTKAILLIAVAWSVATIISSGDQGNSLTTVVENCPAEVRYSGIAFSYNVGMAIFGGTAPLIVSLLSKQFGAIAPAYYLIVMAMVSLVAILSLPPRNKNVAVLI